MAGAFSGHLLNAFNNVPAQPSTPIITSGAMSFDARMHGTPGPSLPPFFSPSPAPNLLFGFTPLSEDSTTAKQIATLQAKLNKRLGPEYISQRPGPGGGPKLTYVEGWKIINLANEVFGFNGWSSSIVSVATDFVDYNEESKRFNIGVTAIVRVTLRDGTFHEDVGYGMLENAKSKAAALDKCKKEAITDALKRTLRNFGNLLGNCLYDKSYAQEVVKIKVPPAKFDKNELHRRPEFEDRVSESPVPHGQAAGASSSTKNKEPRVKVEHESHKAEVPIAYVPRHLRQEMAVAQHAQAQAQTPVSAVSSPSHEAPPHTLTHMSASGSGSDTASTPANRGSPSVNTPKSHGLATPIQTPTQPQRPPPPRVPPPRAVATSPLARMRSAPEPSAPPMPPPMPARAESADPMDDTDLGNRQAIDKDDDDAFPISTQDDAFLATVDLGEGDLGRPIDFDEGVGSVSVMDASMLEQEQKPPAPPPQPQYQHQVRDGESSAGSERGGTYNPSTRNDAQVQPVANPPSRSAGQGQPLPRSGSTSGSASTYTPSMSSTRTGPPVQDIKRPMTISMGGSHYPPGTKPPAQQDSSERVWVRVPRKIPPTGPTNALKRSADVMQTGSGSGSSTSASTRPPMQGIGLAQRQQQHQQQQNACVRRPPDNSDGNDPKRFKR